MLIGYSKEELREHQSKDLDLIPILGWLDSGHEPTQAELALSGSATKHYWLSRSQMTLKDGVLYYKWEDPLEPSLLLVVPHTLKGEVLRICHDTRDYGHTGEKNTYFKVKRSFYWHRRRTDCEEFVRTCASCNRNKKPKQYKRAGLGQFHAGSPMERVHVDVIGPISKSSQGNTVILIVIDQFTKWVECFALPDQCTERVAKTLVDEYFSRMGCPLELHTDQGSNFTSQLFTGVCELLQINKTRTTPYRLQRNGQMERLNRLILQMIRCLRGTNTFLSSLVLSGQPLL